MILTHPTIGAMSIEIRTDPDDRFTIHVAAGTGGHWAVAAHLEWADAQDDFTRRVTAARTKGWA
ncbi:MAG TPA: hypothetical protein VGH54_23520 [Mycobacterium sp.]|jgi:hypothetical protein|uniref:hypothetical protein n=1 Tax=Mycobacterium sp. TaxID=1785 RepID=UPI002F42D2F7